MTGGSVESSVASAELLARFILQGRYLRQDLTVKPDAFIPHPWPKLSVTRHLQLSAPDLWNIARNVARQTKKTLYGRADVRAYHFERQTLQIIPAPISDNPNHANVSGWPLEKSAQKAIAQEIAQAAGKAHIAPPDSD